MKITIMADNDTHLEDIERVFKDSKALSISRKRKYFLDAKILPADICNKNDEHIVFIQKREVKYANREQ